MAEVMRILTSSRMYRDVLDIVSSQVPIDLLTRKRVLITGASGLIGSAIVDLLLHLNKAHGADVEVLAAGRSRGKLTHRFGTDESLSFVSYEDVVSGKFSNAFDFAVLAASPASPDVYVNDPESVVKANTVDVDSILSTIHDYEGKSVVYVSSSEVYGDLVAPKGGYGENEFGQLDTMSRRSCYASSKRRAESICCDYAKKGLRIVIVRPGHVYGPTASHSDHRVSSAWVYDVAAGKDIVMKSDGCQLRSYVHCVDCAAAILAAMCKGVSGEAYNISNRESVISIRDMAAILANAGSVKLRMELPTDSERKTFNPMNNSSLNAQKLETLGWRGKIDARRGFRETVAILREIGGAA